MDQFNSARRLHGIISKAIEHNLDVDKLSVWSTSLGVDKKHRDELNLKISELYWLLSDTERLILKLEGVNDKKSYLKPVLEIRKIFLSQSMTAGAWKEMANPLKSNSLMDLLNICADALESNSQRMGLRKLEEQELEDLRDQIDNVLKKIETSNLETKLKILVIGRLEDIISAISLYQIGGSERLRGKTESAIGAVLTYQSSENEVSDNDKKVLVDVWEVLKRIVLVTSLSEKVPPALEKIGKVAGVVIESAQHLLKGSG